MQLIVLLPLTLLALPTATQGCALALGTGGTLALSADGARFASDAGGLAATFTVSTALAPAATVTVSAPQLTESPAGFNAAAAQLSVAYRGVGTLSTVVQGFTSNASSFRVPALLGVTAITIDNSIASTSGFAAGRYRTRVTITCS